MLARLPLGVLLAVLLLLVPGSGLLLADPDQCVELVTDYSLQCPAWSTQCGSGCFYAVCLDCMDAQHQDHGSHTHHQTCCGADTCTTDTVCDEQGNCTDVTTCVSNCWDCSYSHQNHGFHVYEVSPCILWEYRLYGEPDGSRFDSFNSPNLDGGVPTTLPGPTDCTDEDGAVHAMDQMPRIPYDPSEPGHFRSGRETMPPVQAGDMDGLAVIEGGEGAPRLIQVVPVGGLTVWLPLSGDLGESLQYRYWPYSGFVPIEVRVPYHSLPENGEVTVREPGFYSFQARSISEEGEPSFGSNVFHRMVDPAGMYDVDLAEVIAGLTPNRPGVTPQPPLAVGERPSAPVILGVVPDSRVGGRVEVLVQPGYVGELEYRWWHHSGFYPREHTYQWVRAHPVGGVFAVDGLPVYWDGSVGPEAFLFDFQLRSVDKDGVLSELSEVTVVTVWSRPP